ncbi:MAG: hypothetical protein ACHQ53_05865 [Polyangiales bacterium]
MVAVTTRRRPMRSSTLSLGCLLVVLSWPGAASAQMRRVRPLFEPTDLELEDPGVLELDLQLGVIQGRGPARFVVPDFELNVGLFANLELDLDGAYAVEGPRRGPFSFDHAAPDSLWPAAKVGVYDANDRSARTAFAVGFQLGPKLPVAAASHGLGVEGLALVGTAIARTHLVWNAGAFVDPAPDAPPSRPVGLELGVDVDIDLDAQDQFSFSGSISGVRFLSADPDQLLFTGGITWSPLETLDLSLLGLVGVLQGSDRYGVLVGVSPKLRLFR